MIVPTLAAVPLANAEEHGRAVRRAERRNLAGGLARHQPPKMSQPTAQPGGRQVSGGDRRLLPARPHQCDIFTAGQQAKVPLLVGSNSEEGGWPRRPRNRSTATGGLCEGDQAAVPGQGGRGPEAVSGRKHRGGVSLGHRPGRRRFIGYSTRKWFETHSQTAGKPTYYYFYAHPRPIVAGPGAPP